MAGEWSELDEITLYKALIRCRPLGMHSNFRLINIYMALNPVLSSTPHISMVALRQKLADLYDMDYLESRMNHKKDTFESSEEGSNDDDEDNEETIEIEPHEFELPYLEYHDLIETQAGINGSRTASPESGRDVRSSPARSTKSESIVPDEEEENGDEVDEEESTKEAPTTTKGARISRKRTAAGTIKEPVAVKTSRARRGAQAASTQESVASTPAPTDDESVGTPAVRGRKKTRAAPSRKSTRKR